MKLHLPVLLRKSVLSCLATVGLYTMGSSEAWADNLTFDGTTLIWNTSEDNKSFVDEEDAAASFAAGDNVSFTGESTVTLGENITVGTLDIATGADVTIDLEEYTLHTDTFSLSGTLAVGESLSIASGSTLAVKNAAAVLDSALVLGEKSGLVVESAASLNSHTLTLQGGSNLILTAAGDGKTYTLFSGISSLLDKNGNTLTAGSYSINDYFDKTAPGSGFWADGWLQLTSEGHVQLVRHNEIVKDALDVTTRQTGSVNYSYYAGISFKNLTNTDSNGGAIDGGSNSTITLSNNGSVTFSGNSSSSYGGAIYGWENSTITLSNNGSVKFIGNTASSASTDSNGGAIYGLGDITLSNNGSVEFIGNSASSSSPSDPFASGGAIYGETITLSNNGSVKFIGNTASSTDFYTPSGGAIYGWFTITLSNNDSVEFIGNTVSTVAASGGAIYGSNVSIISLNNNGSVKFIGNTASSSGGAISGFCDHTITLSNNSSVVFEGNTASSLDYTYGGAIDGGTTVTLSNNGSVTFSGNTVSGPSYAYGGAIYTSGSLHIRNNDSVEFAGNVEKRGGAYRLARHSHG